MPRRGGLLVLTLVVVLLAAISTVHAQTPEDDESKQPVLFKADRLRHDEKLGVIVARGNVEFTQGNRTLLADVVTYNQRTDVVTASGKVSILEPTGEVIFADHVELTGNMRDGIVENIRVRLTDDARIAAAGGRRSSGNRTEFRKAVYSPCELCKDDPTRAPIWQVKAVEVTHDQTTKDVEYKDAYLEFYGVPVLYTPYLSHPDPTVERRTGFLVPTYGSDSDLGLTLTTPYYIDIAPDMDATFSPMFTTDQGAVAAGEFRHRLAKGEYDVEGSITQGSTGGGSDDIRGHVRSKFRYDVNRTWRGGSDIYLSSDDTYLRRYDFGSEDTLENRLFLEGFRGRNYASANAYYFQGQRVSDDPGETPIVLPMLDYNFVGEPGRYGSHWLLDANVLGLTRTQDTSTYRVSMKPRWELPYTSSTGEIYRAFASLQADAYMVNDLQESDAPDNTLSGVTGRLFPQVGIDWSLPLARTTDTVTQIIEPVVTAVVAPSGQNHEMIPNEDSLSFEFDDTNLLSPNRFTGLDRVEGGTRVSYGLHGSVIGLQGGFSSFFVGQSYRFTEESDFGEGTGLEDNLSDIVGRIQLSPLQYFNANYRFRLDKDDLSAARNELHLTAGVPELRVYTNYLSIKEQNVNDIVDSEDEFGDREEITLGLTSQITDYWRFGMATRRDLEDGGGSLSHNAFLEYQDDCFIFRTDFVRTFTSDRDIEPSTAILFRFVLRTLGEFETSTGAN